MTGDRRLHALRWFRGVLIVSPWGICDNPCGLESIEQGDFAAAALLLESKIGQHFDAIVTGAAENGTWVRIVHPPAEGKLVQGFEGVDVGDRLHVELLSTDVERGLIDFARA